MEEVILVDDNDAAVGRAEKVTAHREGWLHRAFSIFIFNRRGDLLIQQRAIDKYHSGGLWSNACCGHPRPGEATADAAQRRLREELALECPLTPAFTFRYRADVGNGLVECEIDSVFTGITDTTPRPHPGEAAAVRWITREEIARDVRVRPEHYTSWFKVALERALAAAEPSPADP